MTSKVKYSAYAYIITSILFIGIIIGCVVTYNEKIAFYTFLSIFLILLIAALFCGVISIEVTSKYVIMRSPLRIRKINLGNLSSIGQFQPTLGAIRICGSGGFMGYWGIFKEGDIGRYYAFYGKSSDCFLIRMKNGDKYVIGCENPEETVDYIKSKIVK